MHGEDWCINFKKVWKARKWSCGKEVNLWKITFSEILYCKKEALFRKKLLWKSSSPEKVDVRSIVFLKKIAASKSSTSGKVAVLKKRIFWGRTLLKKQLFWKIWCFVEVSASKKKLIYRYRYSKQICLPKK